MGNSITHILFGKLRVFSFFTDAGQFGASQGHAGAVFIITAIGLKNNRDKWFLFIAGFLALYAMMISGTRGAISVPLGAGLLFIILSKRTSLIIVGGILMVVIFVFFKFTTIGNNVYAIKRMRTAFDPNDPSLQVRLSNQRLLKTYMATRPIGGGIGSTGGFGKQFSPGNILAETPTDSWYVIIWTEQGVVGLTLHLFILFYILTKSSLVIMFRLKNEELKFTIMGLTCGMFGIMIAAYGNAIFGQMPTGITLYMSMAWMFMAQKMDNELEAEKIKTKELN
jgi:cell division protein FtsW (lipid II flippase)